MLTVVVFIAATIQTWRLFEVWHLNKLIFIQSINSSVTAMDMDLIDSFTVKIIQKKGVALFKMASVKKVVRSKGAAKKMV